MIEQSLRECVNQVAKGRDKLYLNEFLDHMLKAYNEDFIPAIIDRTTRKKSCIEAVLKFDGSTEISNVINQMIDHGSVNLVQAQISLLEKDEHGQLIKKKEVDDFSIDRITFTKKEIKTAISDGLDEILMKSKVSDDIKTETRNIIGKLLFRIDQLGKPKKEEVKQEEKAVKETPSEEKDKKNVKADNKKKKEKK